MSSLDSFFTGGLSGLYGAAADPGTYGYQTGGNSTGDSAQRTNQVYNQPSRKKRAENAFQSFLNEFDRKRTQQNTPDEGLLYAFEYLTLDSADNSVYNKSLPQRPSWKQSEKDVRWAYPDHLPQQSFLNGSEATYGTKGSVRPDLYRPGSDSGLPGSSIEVKNYDVSTISGQNQLIKKLQAQHQQRLNHLPQNTRQTAVIDVRGQGLSLSEAKQLNYRLRSALIKDMGVIILIEKEVVNS